MVESAHTQSAVAKEGLNPDPCNLDRDKSKGKFSTSVSKKTGETELGPQLRSEFEKTLF